MTLFETRCKVRNFRKIPFLIYQKLYIYLALKVNPALNKADTPVNLATLFVARQVRTLVVKRAASLFSSFSSNVAKQVARFLLLVLL